MSTAALHDWLVRSYPFPAIEVHTVDVRSRSTLVGVEAGDFRGWARLAPRPPSLAATEAAIVAALFARGAAVCPPVARRDGALAGPAPPPHRSGLLFTEAPGRHVEAPTPAQAEQLGQVLAQLGAAGEAIAELPPVGAAQLVEAPLRRLQPWLPRRIHDDLSRRCWAAAGALDGPRVCVHGDLHLGNVRFAGDRPTLFDLEACGLGPLAYDLACYWRKRVLDDPGGEALAAEWRALIVGYRRVRPLTRQDLAAIPVLAALRALWVFALPAASGETFGRGWLSDPDYIDAHLRMIERLERTALP